MFLFFFKESTCITKFGAQFLSSAWKNFKLYILAVTSKSADEIASHSKSTDDIASHSFPVFLYLYYSIRSHQSFFFQFSKLWCTVQLFRLVAIETCCHSAEPQNSPARGPQNAPDSKCYMYFLFYSLGVVFLAVLCFHVHVFASALFPARFAPWSWFTSVVDEMIETCNYDPNKCTAMFSVSMPMSDTPLKA